MGDLSRGTGISSIRGGDYEIGAQGVTSPVSSGIVIEDITPLALMPLEDSLELVLGTGTATFTRSTTGTFVDRLDGLVKTAAIDVARFEANGVLIEGASTNEALHNRDFTNAVHVKTNVTAAMDAIGADGVANAASTLTATAANGTVFQTITKASAENTYSIDIMRKTGSGTIEISDDGGSTFTDITSSINSVTYTRFQITTTQANPSIGVRIVTSGDEIEVDYEQLEVLPFPSSRIPTTTTSVTRTADNLSIDAANIPGPTLDYSVSASVDVLTNVMNQAFFQTEGEAARQGFVNTTAANSVRYRNGSTIIDGNQIGINTVEALAFTRNAAGIILYQDGIQTASGALTNPTGTITSISIGKQAAANYLFGHIKDFRIYNVALTQSQLP